MEILLQFSDELSLHSLESKHGSLVNCMSISSDTVKPSQVIILKKQKIWQLSNLLSEIGEKLKYFEPSVTGILVFMCLESRLDQN